MIDAVKILGGSELRRAMSRSRCVRWAARSCPVMSAALLAPGPLGSDFDLLTGDTKALSGG